jgi:hypothetical protein
MLNIVVPPPEPGGPAVHRVDDPVPARSLIAVVKLGTGNIAGQAHGSLRGRHFDRLIMALDRLSRPMWCSRLLDEPALAFLGSALTAPPS